MISTIRDVAHKAGVTDTTVSLVFQNHPRISKATRWRVLTVARAMNYSPNLAARNLRRGRTKTKTIGLLVNDITNPFYALMARSAEECAARRGYQILVSDSQWLAGKEVAKIQTMIESRVDGVLACFSEKTKASIELLTRFAIPFLALDTCPPDYTGPFVANDMTAAAQLAAAHLMDIGCRQLLCLAPDHGMEAFSAFKILTREFGGAVRSRGIPFPRNRVISSGLTVESGMEAFDRVVKAFPETDGVLCGNTLCAVGFMEAADQRGIHVGEKIAVMGVDDLDICRLSRISLTSIRQPYEQLTQIAADMLITSIERKTPLEVRVALKPELIARQSTQRFAGNKAKALELETDKGARNRGL